MGKFTLYADKSAGYGSSNPNTNYGSSESVQYPATYLALSFPDVPTNAKYKRLTGFSAYLYVSELYSTGTYTYTNYVGAYASKIDPDAITYATAPTSAESLGTAVTGSLSLPGYCNASVSNDSYSYASRMRNALKNGLRWMFSSSLNAYTSRSSFPPYIVVDYDDADVTLSINISSGTTTMGRGLSSTFSWQATPSSYDTFESVRQASALFQWREGSTGQVHEISCGEIPEGSSLCTLTVPAGTFPAGTIQWRVVATATNGTTATSDWRDREVLDAVIKNAAPSSGFIGKTTANTFSWSLIQPTAAYDQKLTQAAATFRWRTSTTAAATEITCGTASSVTIPAGTFTTNSIQWQVTASTSEGVSATSEWFTLSTLEAAGTAEAVSPDGVVFDATIPNTFTWNHIISTGTAQTKAELQQSTDGSTWTALAMVLGSATSWTAPAGTFTSGQKYWRVRTYNSDNVASEWSASAKFISVGAPDAPVVAVQSTAPRPVIRWQSEEQQAYQVEIERVYSSGTLFGTGKTWQSPRYLADGNYTARVRVQNEYGLWSAWGTAALPVANTPGGTIVLSVTGGIEASLVWSASGFDFYLVYRDGVAIAKVTEPYYTDTASIGTVRYQVRGCYADSSNYSLSEEVSAEITVDRVRICDMEGGGWLEALYESSAHRSTALALGRDIQYVNLSGRAYPVAERSEFLSRSLAITCCCADQAQRQAVRAILGRLVCVKTPEGNMVIGYPGSISENSDGFFSTYSFTVQQIDRKEEIDLDA